jgi:hypothetical protein
VFQFRRNSENLPVVSDSGQDRLAYPPAGIRDESHSAGRIKTRRGFDQAHVAFVDEFMERISRPRVLLRHGHDKTKIGLDQFSKRFLVSFLNARAELLLFVRGQLRKF